MAVRAGTPDYNAVAGEAIEQGDLLYVSAEGQVSKTTAGGDIVVGVATSWAEAAGEAVAIQQKGAARCRAGGTVLAGTIVEPLANGRVGPPAAGTGFGVALTSADDGEYLTVILFGATN